MRPNEDWLRLQSSAINLHNSPDETLELAQQDLEACFEDNVDEQVAAYISCYNVIQREKNARSETWPLERMRERFYA